MSCCFGSRKRKKVEQLQTIIIPHEPLNNDGQVVGSQAVIKNDDPTLAPQAPTRDFIPDGSNWVHMRTILRMYAWSTEFRVLVSEFRLKGHKTIRIELDLITQPRSRAREVANFRDVAGGVSLMHEHLGAHEVCLATVQCGTFIHRFTPVKLTLVAFYHIPVSLDFRIIDWELAKPKLKIAPKLNIAQRKNVNEQVAKPAVTPVKNNHNAPPVRQAPRYSYVPSYSGGYSDSGGSGGSSGFDCSFAC
ncbi:hypothetical protein HJFPF1_05547 [Paramyrothecium foliicola]|nr:hypothetical protein HJFPF1_05547 [Paramyrothecium foliicola]